MSERKVLNKYYPPDFDPAKIPRMKLSKNRQYTVRLMAPFNMRCETCGEYIYKGKKFNARKEDVEGDSYLGIRIYRFYIKCTRCLQEISFKTDPKNTDYEIEAGATRNFMALKLAEEQAKREEDEEKEEEATNPMKLLEKRTQQSKQELELLESLEELKDLNRRQQIIDYNQMLEQYDTTAARIRTEKEQEEYDEQLVKEIFKSRKKLTGKVVEEEVVELEEVVVEPPSKIQKSSNAPAFSSKPISIAEKRNKFGIKIKSDNKSTTSAGTLSEGKQSEADDSNPLVPSATPSSNIEDMRKNLGIKVKSSSDSTTEASKQNTSTADSSVNGASNSVNKPSGLSLLGAYSGSETDEEEQ